MNGERANIELFTLSSMAKCRDDWKQLTFINETEARAVSCDVIIVTSHVESFGSILGHFSTFATPSALYQWSCLGLPYRAVGCILHRSVTPCIPDSCGFAIVIKRVKKIIFFRERGICFSPATTSYSKNTPTRPAHHKITNMQTTVIPYDLLFFLHEFIPLFRGDDQIDTCLTPLTTYCLKFVTSKLNSGSDHVFVTRDWQREIHEKKDRISEVNFAVSDWCEGGTSLFTYIPRSSHTSIPTRKEPTSWATFIPISARCQNQTTW